MFRESSFNQNINSWNVGSVSDLSNMFLEASSFNQDLSSWDVGTATNMAQMFYGASSFNQDLSSWDVSSASNMFQMFYEASSFNQDLSTWDVSRVVTMSGMFRDSPFNQDLSAWEVSRVTNMSNMFRASSFNQDLSTWDVSSVATMSNMFRVSSFDQDLSSWEVTAVTDMRYMFDNSELSTKNYDKTLIGWSQLDLQPGVALGAISTYYCSGSEARQGIIDAFGWAITDAGESCAATASTTSIEKNVFTIFPNPTADFLSISDIQNPTPIRIYNLLGKEVLSSVTSGSVNVQSLAKGIYVIHIKEGVKEVRKKFIKN
jgi:surface protein